VNFFTPAGYARPTHQLLFIPIAIPIRYTIQPSHQHYPTHHSEFLTATSVPMSMPKMKHSMISLFAPENSASKQQPLVDPEQNRNDCILGERLQRWRPPPGSWSSPGTMDFGVSGIFPNAFFLPMVPLTGNVDLEAPVGNGVRKPDSRRAHRIHSSDFNGLTAQPRQQSM